jgi:hypothetical protein
VQCQPNRYLISSLAHDRLTPEQWLLLLRRHWGVETGTRRTKAVPAVNLPVPESLDGPEPSRPGIFAIVSVLSRASGSSFFDGLGRFTEEHGPRLKYFHLRAEFSPLSSRTYDFFAAI